MLNQFSRDLTQVSRLLVGEFLSYVYGLRNKGHGIRRPYEEFFAREHERCRKGISLVAVYRTMHEDERKYTSIHTYTHTYICKPFPNSSRLFRAKLAIPSSTSSQ